MKFNDLIVNLQGNPNLIAEFITNPEGVLQKYDLTNEENSALLSGNLDSLVNLGLSDQLAAGVLSGAHTPSCNPVTTKP